MKKLLFYIFFTFFSLYLHESEGIGVSQNYGNIQVMSYKEVNREDFQKAFIIGQLTEKLARELNYNAPIYLECYLSSTKPDTTLTDYHIAFQNYKFRNETRDGSEKLIIRQEAKNYNILETLKIVEYAIKNESQIKQRQKLLKSNLFYDRGKERLSINQETIDHILKEPKSDIINKVMQTRIDRPIISSTKKSHLSYYWQNNQYYVYRIMKIRNEKEAREVVILSLPQIYQFEDLDLSYLIFDQVDSFYSLNINSYDLETGMNKISKKHIISDSGIIDYGKRILRISDDGNISIFFTHGAMGSGKKRLLLYNPESDTLIQDVYTTIGIKASNWPPTT